jgi:hypothetical protein
VSKVDFDDILNFWFVDWKGPKVAKSGRSYEAIYDKDYKESLFDLFTRLVETYQIPYEDFKPKKPMANAIAEFMAGPKEPQDPRDRQKKVGSIKTVYTIAWYEKFIDTAPKSPYVRPEKVEEPISEEPIEEDDIPIRETSNPVRDLDRSLLNLAAPNDIPNEEFLKLFDAGPDPFGDTDNE